jgi:flap endonuclease-1
MGIDKFYQIVIPNGKTIESISTEVPLSKLKGYRFCIDASGMIYSSILAMSHVTALTDSEGNTTSHINTILSKILMLDAAGISQIWIFDSPILNPIKAKELEARRAKAYKSTDPKVQFRMTTKHVDDIKTLLTNMGVAWVVAPTGIEAEQYGAWMTKGDIPDNRFCQYMMSYDSDVLGFGGNLIRPYQKPSATGKSKRVIYQLYELSEILDNTQLTYEQFLIMCVAMGTDFCDKTPRIGVKTVISAVKENKIELTSQQHAVIDYYKTTASENEVDTNFSEYNKDKLVSYLKSKGFNEARLNERLVSYPKTKN